jgi:putative sigma-54 modulation protein
VPASQLFDSPVDVMLGAYRRTRMVDWVSYLQTGWSAPGKRGDSGPATQKCHTHMEYPMEQPIEFLIRAGQSGTIETLREYAVQRLSFALRRFDRRIRHITVRIADVNGPRRGVDSRCSMSVDLIDGGQIFVKAISAWPFAAVSQAAGRLSKVLRRKGGRETAHRHSSGHLGDLDIA